MTKSLKSLYEKLEYSKTVRLTFHENPSTKLYTFD